jgi:nucleoside-triphosphatase
VRCKVRNKFDLIVQVINNILLEGEPGVGKTTLILNIAERLFSYRIGGFYTKEIREHGQRIGFRLATFSGQSGILSHIKFTAGPIVGKYRVNLPEFEKIAVDGLEIALSESSIILIDEIGKMELFSERFKEILPRCFASEKTLIATIMSHANPYVDSLKTRSDVRLIKVTKENRNKLALTLIEEIIN